MKLYWLWLSLLEGLSNREKLSLLEHFGNPEDLYYADEACLSQLPLSQKLREALLDKSLDAAEAFFEKCEKDRIGILPIDDPRFSQSLRNISDPPLLLYWKGRLPELNDLPLVGVVGTRKATPYGLKTARELSFQLAGHGAAVVSGMADGIDGAATLGALEGNGTVIGVLGCGVDIVYPRRNRELFQSMEGWGCLISEYPPGTRPAPWHFPQRNRIISGLSMAVLVVEAPAKSGALITARCALEQGRDVFVVPGNLGQSSFEGSLSLLRDGAAIITCAWDLLGEYESQYPGKLKKEAAQPPISDKIPIDNPAPPSYHVTEAPSREDLDPQEKRILEALGPEDRHIDTLIAGTGLPSAEILAALTMLEVKGYVITRPGGWARTSENH